VGLLGQIRGLKTAPRGSLLWGHKYIERFVEGCLERIGEDETEDEDLFRDLWEDEGERETVLMVLQGRVRGLAG
jgi:hypothetical protein